MADHSTVAVIPRSIGHVTMSSKRLFITGPNDLSESEHILCGVCECPVNLMLGPVIRTPLLDRMSIQLQFTLRNTVVASVHEFYVLEKKMHYVNTKTLFTTPCVLCQNTEWEVSQLFNNQRLPNILLSQLYMLCRLKHRSAIFFYNKLKMKVLITWGG
jgi:hypothetical protein